MPIQLILLILVTFVAASDVVYSDTPPTSEKVRDYSLPPTYHVKAASLYHAGFQIGTLAASQINQWFQLDEFKATYAFAHNQGAAAFAAFKADNTQAFPELIREMQGMADGAKVTLDKIWVSNLIPELESLMPANTKTDHCTDIFSHDTSGNFIQGHNEDWSEAVKPLWYFVRLSPLAGANFTACAGMAYPGTILGYAATWSKYMYSTQNTLFPRTTKTNGLACTFVQRRATCGIGLSETTTLAQSIARLDTGGWAASASINLVSLTEGGMSNVEAYENGFDAMHVAMNYSHMNMFKHLPSGEKADAGDASTEHRQKRVFSLPVPRTVNEVAKVLGDTEGQQDGYPIYRTITLATLIVSEKTKELTVWVDANPSTDVPQLVWNLTSW